YACFCFTACPTLSLSFFPYTTLFRSTGIFNATGGAELGITAGSATAITADEIIDLVYSLKAPYRKNASFIMNDATIKAIRKLKEDRKSTRLNSSHVSISYAVFCLKKK